jgi:hypothetical protein
MNIGYVCPMNQISKTVLGSFTSLLRQFYFHYSRCHVMKTGRGRSLKGTYCGLRSCNGRGRPFSTWAIRNTFHWCTSATYTHRSGYRLKIESGVLNRPLSNNWTGFCRDLRSVCLCSSRLTSSFYLSTVIMFV